MQLFSPAFKLTPEARQRCTRVALGVGLLVVATVALQLVKWSRGGLPSEDPRADLQLLAGLFLMRCGAAVALLAMATAAVVLVFRVLERTRIGHQLFKWRPDTDPANVPAARTLGAAMLIGQVFLGVCLLFSGVVR